VFTFHLVDWWRSYGGRAIKLQRLAKRIVSLCASSSGCERNWSTFNFVSILVTNKFLFRCIQSDFFLFSFPSDFLFVDAYKEKEASTQETE
jgi:hypothetical protein